MTDTQVRKKEEQSPDAGAGQGLQRAETESIYVPDVDIRESEESILLVADMPGVDQGSADVTVENGVLTIEGRGHVDGPEGYDLVGTEYGVGRYRRDFTLSDAADTEGIRARVRHGVLEVTIPKRDVVKTRKVAIES